MDADAHLEHLRRDANALALAARSGLGAPVPSCPGWAVADLVEHVGRVHRWVVRSLDADPAQRVAWVADDDPAPGDDLVGWYDERIDELLGRFASIDRDAVVATFSGPQPAAWWMRRQAHEVAVHRWDAERAHASAQPVDPELASDGIDEYLTTFLPRWKGKLGNVGGSAHLHCTDVAGEWLVRFDQEAPTVERAHAKGDVAARGAASDLLLLVWGRVAPADVEVIGDGGVLDRWLAAVNVV